MTQTPGVLQSAFDLTVHCFPEHFESKISRKPLEPLEVLP
jgi:hypothetical protein